MLFMRDYVRKSVAAQNYTVPKEVKALVLAMCHLCKVRGYKTVIKFFPHEVSDMEPVTELLHFQDVFALKMERTQTAAAQVSREWQVSYLLIIWLQIIVLVPFDLATIDSDKNKENVTLVKRIINIGTELIRGSGKLKEAASVMLAKLLTRPDVIKIGETDTLLKSYTEIYE